MSEPSSETVVLADPADTSRGGREKNAAFVTEFEQLVWELKRSPVRTRVRAACRLAVFGAEAVEPLCGALQDENPPVRVEAAESLGRIGEARAIPALTAEVKKGLEKETARWQLFTAGATILVAVFLWSRMHPNTLIAAQDLLLALVGMISAGISARLGLERERYKKLAFVAMVRALGDIAERQPALELQAAVPELTIASRDILQETGEVRRVSRETVRRIELATEKLKSLPLAGAAAAPPAEALPRAARVLETEPANLPVPSE